MTDRLGVRDLSGLSAARWQSIEPIIDAALDLPREERGAYLRARCTGDASLLADVEQLLAAHDVSTAAFDTPAAARFASLLDAQHPPLPNVVGERYRIGPMLGRGGMATVFLADDLRHERQVAVKVLHADLAAALGAELFLAEIKTTAQLHHPHILPLHDSGDAGGVLYYVMPYVAGGTLRHRLNNGEVLSIDETLRIVTEVASALDAAHRHGVVHRDIKPENILLHDGTALVADFGIALAVRTAATGRETARAVILGTRQYMSPEQATRDAAVDGRSDVYSLGVVVYEMLTGGPPFDAIAGDRKADLLPSVHASREEAPAAVDAVLVRALAAAPEDRHATAGEFAAELRHALTAPVPHHDQKHAERGSRRALWLLAVAGVVLVAGGTALVVRWPRSADVPRHRGSANQEALNFFHDGTARMENRTLMGIARAESSFKRAIAADSNLADAHAWLAQVYAVYGIGNVGDFEPEKYFPVARKEAERAIALDSTVAQAYVSAANVSLFYDMDWARAERELERALTLEPQSVEARAAKVSFLYFVGRFKEAIQEALEETWLQARTEQPKVELARALFLDRQYAAATAQIISVLGRDSTRLRAHLLLGEVLSQERKYDSAVSEMRLALEKSTESSRTQAYLAHVYARAGRLTDAHRELGAIREKARHTFVPALDFAIAYVGFGEIDSTFVWLNKAIDDHSMRPYVFDPTFDTIRSDGRYQQLLRRMHLPYRPAAR